MDARDAHETLSEVKTDRGTRYIALLIAILGALIAIVEVAAGSAEQNATKSNIDGANLWAFFQAKTIRQSNLRALVEYAELELPELSPERAERARQQVTTWRATIDRLESEPPTQEGRKELIVRAKATERERDTSLAAGNMFDFASASFQLGIVLASAGVVISTPWLAWVAGGVGFVGLGFALLGWLAPTLIAL
jgi:hypothetical protein